MLLTDKQTDRQNDKQKNKQTNQLYQKSNLLAKDAIRLYFASPLL